jgi:hypothetical protein
MTAIFGNARDLYKKHERWIPIVFFIAGFVFDAFMLRRVDELLTIIQQAAYIIISALLIRVEIVENQREIHIPKFLVKIWQYREAALHFLMGTLLNSYTIFYFKSASALTSFVFIALLVLLLTLNEFGRFGKSQTQVHIALLSLCLISYLVTLVPIILGSIGVLSFIVANILAVLIFWLFVKWSKTSIVEQPKLIMTHFYFPFGGILAIFAILYFAHAIPPVPLSVRYMGVYHDVKKVDGSYELSYTRSTDFFSFWQHGDQQFSARAGDEIYCYARIFSPARFKDQLHVRWLFFDSKLGWKTSDMIPLPVVGGREDGYRGFTKKTNYQPGQWRVQIETNDNREIGRINFNIETDETTDERVMETKVE